MDRIRVATLNIWNRMGPWEERLAAIRKEIERLQPDVLGLQEVLVIPELGFDQAKAIAEGFGYHVAFGRSPDGEVYTLGNAVLSRWPIARTFAYALPGTDEHRSLVFAEIDSPAGKIPFFSTHLNWKFEESAVRQLQVQCLTQFVDACARAENFPAIVVGDFNAEPDSDEIRFMRGLGSLGGRSVHYHDVFGHVGSGPGVTFSLKNPYAALLREPDRRIDYIWVRGGDERFRGEPLSARVAFDVAEGDAYPSDHFGVFAELRA
ncbi:MAG TPA: endonuclease/exonuclease/phosphatase family protein [Polyangiaceae bacterium]|jgi:endonuclease/exonuclease/phosphatase family metal-dependent hydrolase